MAWAYVFTSIELRLHVHMKSSDHGNKPFTPDGVQHLNFTFCGNVIGDTYMCDGSHSSLEFQLAESVKVGLSFRVAIGCSPDISNKVHVS